MSSATDIVPLWVQGCGQLAPLASIVVFLAPIPTMRQISKDRSVGSMPLLPYSSMVSSAFVWITYGTHRCCCIAGLAHSLYSKINHSNLHTYPSSSRHRNSQTRTQNLAHQRYWSPPGPLLCAGIHQVRTQTIPHFAWKRHGTFAGLRRPHFGDSRHCHVGAQIGRHCGKFGRRAVRRHVWISPGVPKDCAVDKVGRIDTSPIHLGFGAQLLVVERGGVVGYEGCQYIFSQFIGLEFWIDSSGLEVDVWKWKQQGVGVAPVNDHCNVMLLVICFF
jgi:hypothetical protein